MSDTKIIISYKGIPDGFQDYEFIIGNDFFSNLDYSLIEHGDLSVKIKMEKRNDIITMDLNIEGSVEVQCDRCLDLFLMPLHYEGRVIAGNNNEAEDEEKVSINTARMEVDLTHYIYESIILSIPIQCIHPNDENGKSTCNKEMIKLIRSYTINAK